MRVKYLSVKSPKAKELRGRPKDCNSGFSNFHKSGSIKGMKEKFYGKDALLVQSGNYIYNVTSSPVIYYNWAK